MMPMSQMPPVYPGLLAAVNDTGIFPGAPRPGVISVTPAMSEQYSPRSLFDMPHATMMAMGPGAPINPPPAMLDPLTMRPNNDLIDRLGRFQQMIDIGMIGR